MKILQSDNFRRRCFFVLVILALVTLASLSNRHYCYKMEYFRIIMDGAELQENIGNSVIQRVSQMNDHLDTLRQSFLMITDANQTTLYVDKEPVVLVDERDQEFDTKLKNFSCVHPVLFKWIRKNESNSTVQDLKLTSEIPKHGQFRINDVQYPTENYILTKYYRFTASEPLCQWIKSDQAGRFYSYVYNYTCNNDTQLAVEPLPIDPLRWNMRTPEKPPKFPPGHMFKFPDQIRIMRIYLNSLVSGLGEPYCDRLQVRPYDCLPRLSQRLSKTQQKGVQYHDEIFVISQYWGTSYYHMMIEDLPRLALFVSFLKKNPSIKILAAGKSKILENALDVLGINKDRVITGWTKTKIAYVPRPTSCGTSNLLEIQFLHRYYRKYILEKLLKSKRQRRNKLVLIRRSGWRHFTEHGLIHNYLSAIALEFGLEFVVFRDDPVPIFNNTMLIFGSAAIVVAPHGAGLSNVIFSQPGTLVIEGLCNKPHLNLCYHPTMYQLGLIWHGILSSGGCEGVVQVDARVIDKLVREYLKVIPIEQFVSAK